MNIFLIGFMGSGKSTIGKRLAKRLNLEFLDMDREIESACGKSIPEIFREKGEDYFRQLESEWLQNFDRQNCVVSTGGGTPCYQDNLSKMKNLGRTVFLSVRPEVLANRLFNAKQNRPLIQDYIHNTELLTRFVKDKLSDREVYYKQCDIELDATDFDSARLESLCNLLQPNSSNSHEGN